MHSNGHILWLEISLQVVGVLETSVLKVAERVPCEGRLQRVVVAVVTAKHGAKDGLSFLRSEASV